MPPHVSSMSCVLRRMPPPPQKNASMLCDLRNIPPRMSLMSCVHPLIGLPHLPPPFPGTTYFIAVLFKLLPLDLAKVHFRLMISMSLLSPIFRSRSMLAFSTSLKHSFLWPFLLFFYFNLFNSISLFQFLEFYFSISNSQNFLLFWQKITWYTSVCWWKKEGASQWMA